VAKSGIAADAHWWLFPDSVAVRLASGCGSFPGIQIQQINLNDGWRRPIGLRLNILGDIAHHSGRRENHGGRGVAKHRTNALIVGAAQRNGKRNRDKSRL
jgi:hypothetical protein